MKQSTEVSSISLAALRFTDSSTIVREVVLL